MILCWLRLLVHCLSHLRGHERESLRQAMSHIGTALESRLNKLTAFVPEHLPSSLNANSPVPVL